MGSKIKVLKGFSFDNRKFNIKSKGNEVVITVTNNKIPTLDEVKNYFNEKKFIINSEEFFNHYNSYGWKTNWKASAKNWNDRDIYRKQFANNENNESQYFF